MVVLQLGKKPFLDREAMKRDITMIKNWKFHSEIILRNIYLYMCTLWYERNLDSLRLWFMFGKLYSGNHVTKLQVGWNIGTCKCLHKWKIWKILEGFFLVFDCMLCHWEKSKLQAVWRPNSNHFCKKPPYWDRHLSFTKD